MNVRTQISTLMNDIGLLYKEIGDKHIALSGIMGQGVEEVVQAVTPAPVVELPKPVVPISVDTVPVTPMVAPIAHVAPVTESAVTSEPENSTELDDEGYPWDERIHVASKSQIKSKLVKNGKAWRLQQKADPAIVEQIRAEFKGDTPVAAPVAPVAAPVAPVAAPDTPVAAPVAPVAAPVAPTVDYDAIKAEVIKIINNLVTEFSVEYDDILESLREEFKIVNFEDLTTDKYQAVLDSMTGLYNSYKSIHDLTLEIYKIGGDAYTDHIKNDLTNIYKGANTDCLGGVHFTELPNIKSVIETYHKSWADSGLGV